MTQTLTEKQAFAKLQWHCRRGMLELDLLLLPFVRQCYPSLSPRLQQDFTRLLDCNDQALYRWFIHYETPSDETLTEIITLITDYAKSTD